MKYGKFLLFILSIFVFSTCELERDNPLDKQNPNYDPNYYVPGGVDLKFSNCEIVQDNNGDGLLNPGETVYLKISLKNIGINNANGTSATFSSNSSYVSGLSPTTVSIGTINANSTVTPANSYSAGIYYTTQFTISSTTPIGTKIPINIHMSDGKGNSWDDSFEIVVGQTSANIKFSSFTIVKDNNENGTLNPGETAYLKISFKNSGSSKANSVSATFSSNSSYVSGLSPTTVSIGTINANSTVTPANSYSSGTYYTTQFTVSTSALIGAKIPISVHLTDTEGNSWDDSFEITIEQSTAKIEFLKYEIVKDGNENGALNPGETVYLKVSFKNTSNSKANSVSATFSSNSSYASGLSPTTVSIGTINANSTVTPANSYSSGTYYTTQFTVSTSALIGAKIPISVHLTDAEGNSWDDSFEITIEQSTAKIEFLKYEIVKDGNENGALNPGETVYLKISFKNTGNGKANSVSATFSSNSSYASGLSPTTVSIGTINANSTVTPANSYSSGTYYTTQFTISTSALIGAKIPINVHLTDTEGNSWDDSFEIPVEETMKAKIIVSEYEIFYGAPQNDKVPVVLKLTFKNTSSNALVGTAYAKFSSSSSYVSSLTPTSNIYLSNMAAGTSETIANDYYSGQLVTSDDKLLNYGSYYTIKFNVPGNTAIGTKVPIDVAFKDSYNTTWTQTFNVIIE